MGMPQPMGREAGRQACSCRGALQHKIDGALGEVAAGLAGPEDGIVVAD